MRGSNARQLIALYLGFVVTGAGTALLGPLLPALSQRLHLSDAQSGRLFTAQFLGSFLVALSSSIVIARAGTKGSIAAAFALMAAGFGAAALASWPLLLFCVVVYGAGLGLSNPATTLKVAALAYSKSAVPMNRLNFAWCAGALAAPVIVPVALSRGSVPGVFAAMAIIAAAVTVAVGATVSADRSPPAGDTSEVYRREPRLAALTSALLFLYVGAETSIAGWTPMWASRMGARENVVGVPASCFWAGILVARLLAGIVLRRISAPSAILAGLALNGAAIAAMLLFNSLPALFAGAAAAGLGYGLVFPTAVAIFCDATGPGAVRAANFLFASGALGGALLPLATGWVVSRFGEPRPGLLLAAGCTAAMIGLGLAIRTRNAPATVTAAGANAVRRDLSG